VHLHDNPPHRIPATGLVQPTAGIGLAGAGHTFLENTQLAESLPHRLEIPAAGTSGD